jgi:hypothetical protein
MDQDEKQQPLRIAVDVRRPRRFLFPDTDGTRNSQISERARADSGNLSRGRGFEQRPTVGFRYAKGDPRQRQQPQEQRDYFAIPWPAPGSQIVEAM